MISLFSSISEAKEEKIFVAANFALIVYGSGRVGYENCVITNFYHVPNLSASVLSIPTNFSWEVHQMDMNGAFLHGDLTKESHMEQRPSFV